MPCMVLILHKLRSILNRRIDVAVSGEIFMLFGLNEIVLLNK